MLCGTVLHSVVLWPLTKPLTLSPYALSGLAHFGASALNYGLSAALPIARVTLLTSVLTGALSRLSPQAQVLAIGSRS